MNKKLLLGTILGTLIFATPVLSASVKVMLDTKDTGFKRQPFYVLYLANDKGEFVKTLRQFGYNGALKAALRNWHPKATAANEDIDALTGASLRGGEVYTEIFEIGDMYINKGYKIIVESVSAKGGHQPKEAYVTLDPNKKMQTMKGKVHTDSLTVKL